jgi:acetoin utilization protein AcuC
MARAALVYSPKLAEYEISPTHPLKGVRLKCTYELIKACGLLDREGVVCLEPEPAARPEIELVHDPRYVSVVEEASAGRETPDLFRYGLGTGDNPVFAGMYERSALSMGGSRLAADLVAKGEVAAAFNIGGGLHHAHWDRAAGFCVFNDPALAIRHLLRLAPEAKVAYVDVDGHHGDGVQEAFYESRQVLTISLHESGRFLFPGTGEVWEIGQGEGRGYAVNLPLAPDTGPPAARSGRTRT